MASLDPKTVKYLEKNKVEGIDKIKFQDEGHLYWAYSEYYSDWVSTHTGVGGLPLISATTILGKYFKSDMDAIALRTWNNPQNRFRMVHDPTYKYYNCQSVQDIKDIWSVGATLGSKMHGHFEDLANLVEYDKDHPGPDNTKIMQKLYHDANLGDYKEVNYFYEFVKRLGLDDPNSDFCFYRTELLMWHDVLHLSGAIDALLYNKADDSYIIVDWKRVKNGLTCDPKNPRKPVSALSASSRCTGLASFECMRNHNYNKYGCQLTIYKKIFEHMTGKKVSGLFIVAIDSTKIGHPSALHIHNIPIDKFDRCINDAFEERAREMLGKCEDTLDDDHMDRLIEIIDAGEKLRAAEAAEAAEELPDCNH